MDGYHFERMYFIALWIWFKRTISNTAEAQFQMVRSNKVDHLERIPKELASSFELKTLKRKITFDIID